MKDFYKVVPCYLFSFSATGYVTSMNDQLLLQLGYTGDEVIGVKKFDTMLSLGSRIFFQTHFYPLVNLNNNAEEIYLTFKTKEGAEIPVLLNASIEITSKEVYCIGMRISERVKFERTLRQEKKAASDAFEKNEELTITKEFLEKNQQELDKKSFFLEQRNAELSELNKLLSHDLQEPLRKVAILLDRYITQKADTLNASDAAQLRKISAISIHMRQILISLQDYSAVTKKNASFTLVDTQQLFEKLGNEYAGQIGIRNGRLTINGPLPKIEGDPELVYSLFKNILDNAVKFYDPVKRGLLIDISCTEIEDNLYRKTENKFKYVKFARFTFKDNGIGFDKSYSQQMFSLFRTITDVNYPGIGLGLALAKKITDIHHGAISADATQGEGSTFVVTLPITQPQG